LSAARDRVPQLTLTPPEAARFGFRVNADGQRRDLLQLLGYPDISFDALAAVWPELALWPDDVREQIEIDASYAGYLDRQAADVDAFRRDENLHLPSGLDYSAVGGLSSEAQEKLSRIRPMTLGQAGRIEGITPGALTALLSHVRRHHAA
jgi:tRNA uridine 5-carboxymethylaminomethyl modification enzyme